MTSCVFKTHTHTQCVTERGGWVVWNSAESDILPVDNVKQQWLLVWLLQYSTFARRGAQMWTCGRSFISPSAFISALTSPPLPLPLIMTFSFLFFFLYGWIRSQEWPQRSHGIKNRQGRVETEITSGYQWLTGFFWSHSHSYYLICFLGKWSLFYLPKFTLTMKVHFTSTKQLNVTSRLL